tara:strand:+ start:93 stop:578 length:486 start_codon:yes stop_codon:yes gene_type:complete
MSFLIRPLESILDAPALVCCVDGKTPTESDPEDFSANFTEVTVDNGDGTHTTTWTTISDDEGITAFNFYLCCSSKVVIVWAPTEPTAVFNAPMFFEGNNETAFGGGSATGGWHWDSDIDAFFLPSQPGLTVDDMNTPCGLKVSFEFSSLGAGDVNVISITY